MFSICHFLTTCNIVSWFTSSSSFTHMFESTHIWRNSQSDTRVPCLRKDWHHHQMQKFHTNVIKYTDNLLHCCMVFAPFTILSHLAKFSRAVRRIRTICPSGKIVQIGCETFTWSRSSVTIIHFHLHNPMRNWNEEASYMGLGNTLTRVKYHWLAHHIKRWAFQKDHKHDSVVRMHWPATVLDSGALRVLLSGLASAAGTR